MGANNSPALRFPEYSGDWEYKKVSEILEPVSQKVNVKEDELYQQIGIRSHGKGVFHKELVTGKSLGNKRVFWIQENLFVVNIVFAWEQAVAKTTKGEEGMIASHRFPMFRPLNGLCSIDYILYKFLTKKGKYLLELASPGGAGRNKTLGQGEFKKLKLATPLISEQQKIASFLFEIDKKIEQITNKKKLLADYKKGVMQQIFSQEIRFKQDDGGEYPEWEVKVLGDIVSFIRNGLSLDQNSEKKGYPVTRIETISNKVIDMNKVGYVATEVDVSEHKLQVGDILFSNINSVAQIGKISFLDKDYGLYHGMNLLNIRFNIEQCHSRYGFYFLGRMEVKQHFEKICNKAVNQASINQTELKKTEVNLPSLPEQQKIANFLTEIDTKIIQVEKQLAGTKQFKSGLLQQMFV